MSDFGFLGKTISVDMPTDEDETSNFGDAGEVLTETAFEKEIRGKVNIIILNPKNENFDEMEVGDIRLFGKSLVDYVINSCPFSPKVLNTMMVVDVLAEIKPYLNNCEYTLVLYSDTPLITKRTILEILEFVYYKGINVCKFNRGYCFKTEYIKRVSEIFSAQDYTFEEEDFVTVVDTASLGLVKEIMKNRICAFHMKNGVYIASPDETYIESDVIIDKGVQVEANTRLCGKSEIGKNAIIGYGSVIDNSKVDEDASILSSVITNSVIGAGTVIQNGQVIESKLDENVQLADNVYVSASSVNSGVSIGANTHVYCASIERDVNIAEDVIISKTEGYRTLVGKEATIGAGVKILGGITISKNAEIKPFEVITKNV